MADKLRIINRGLQRIGARRLATLVENTRERQEADAVYDEVVREELRKNFWTFAIELAEITANATAPAFGRSFAYDLPSNFLRLAPQDPYQQLRPTDFQFVNDSEAGTRQILTDDGGPLQIRYVRDDVTEADFDDLFAAALSARIGLELAEVLTQSSSKLTDLESAYTQYVTDARRVNSIESGPIAQEVDELVMVRLSDQTDPALRRFS